MPATLSLLMALLGAVAMATGCGDDGGGGASGSGEADNAVEDPGDGDDGDGDGEGDENAESEEPIELAGTWYNVTLEFVETFSSTAITGDDFVTVDIAAYDNELNAMVLRFVDEDDPSQSIYTKVVWLEPDASGFYYCPVAFELTSVEEALEADDVSDSSDPENGGCEDEPWMRDIPVADMPDND